VGASQVALPWLADQPAVTSVILGVRTTDQLADNLAAAELRLTEGEMLRLSESAAPISGSTPTGRSPRNSAAGSSKAAADWLGACRASVSRRRDTNGGADSGRLRGRGRHCCQLRRVVAGPDVTHFLGGLLHDPAHGGMRSV
jgi:hypothetical protein